MVLIHLDGDATEHKARRLRYRLLAPTTAADLSRLHDLYDPAQSDSPPDSGGARLMSSLNRSSG